MNTPFHSSVAHHIDRFLRHHRSLGKRFDNEEAALRLFDRYLAHRHVDSLAAVTPAVVEAFMGSRPRGTARSYNHLLGVIERLFRWLVAQQALASSPVSLRPRRNPRGRTPFLFEPAQVGRLLRAAADLGDAGPHACRRGPTYRMIFALMYALGLRVGEVSRLRREDLDIERRCFHIAGTKFGKSRLVPFGDRVANALGGYLEQHGRGRRLAPDDPLFSLALDGRRAIAPKAISRTFRKLPAPTRPPCARRRCGARACTACATRSPCRPCCGGTARGSTRAIGCSICRSSSATSTRRPRPCT